MANAKKCDACGKFFVVPELEPGYIDHEKYHNYLKVHKAEKPDRNNTDVSWFHFDICDECYDDFMEYMLSKAATRDAN
jgi:hypothetical protein